MSTKNKHDMIIYNRMLFELTIIKNVFENHIQTDKYYIDTYMKLLNSINDHNYIILQNLLTPKKL